MTQPDADALNRKVFQWLTLAEEDLLMARHALILKDDCPFRLVTYHAQQCVEKYLKGYLVFKNVDFPRTHSVDHLLELCSPFQNWIETLDFANELTFYAVSTRYPGNIEEIDLEDAEQAIAIAVEVRDTIRQVLKSEGFVFPSGK